MIWKVSGVLRSNQLDDCWNANMSESKIESIELRRGQLSPHGKFSR